MVQGHHEVSSVLGHIHVHIPVAGQQLRRAVGQVGAHHIGQLALGHSLVKLGQAAGEQREGSVGDDDSFFFLPSYRNLVRFIDFALESYGEKE